MGTAECTFFIGENMSTRKINNIIKKVKKDMQMLGIYKTEYDSMIKVYADIKFQYDNAMKEYQDMGYPVTVECAGGIKKHPYVIQLEDLRKQLVTYSDRLGLNPKALDSIRNAQTVEVQTGLEKSMEEITEAIKNGYNG